MKKILIVGLCLFSFSNFAKKIEVKKRSAKVIVDIDVPKEFEVKKNLFNTPVIIWHKKLKHQGPTLAVFPLKKAPLGHGSSKAIKTNFSKYKKEQTKNLQSLKATKIKFMKPAVIGNTTRFSVRYTMSNISRLYASETHKVCKNKSGLNIRTLLKKEHVKEFESTLEKMVDTLKCD
jgi:hypothetical protein